MLPGRTISAIIVAVITSGARSAGASPPENVASAPSYLAGACVQLDRSIVQRLRLAQAEPTAASAAANSRIHLAQAAPSAAARPPIPPRELRRPMNDAELRLAMELLTALTTPVEKQSKSLRASEARFGAMSMERLGVLVLDSSAILTRIHLQETLRDLRRNPKVDQALLAWGAEAGRALDGCLRERYAPFGGDPVYQQVATLVSKNRARLEPLIIGAALDSRLPGEPRTP